MLFLQDHWGTTIFPAIAQLLGYGKITKEGFKYYPETWSVFTKEWGTLHHYDVIRRARDKKRGIHSMKLTWSIAILKELLIKVCKFPKYLQSQLIFTCLKSTIETLENGVSFVDFEQVNVNSGSNVKIHLDINLDLRVVNYLIHFFSIFPLAPWKIYELLYDK